MNSYTKRILLITGFLFVFGIFAMYSVSIFESFKVTQNWAVPINSYYFFEHLQKIVIGIVVSLILRYIPWKNIKRFDTFIFACGFILVGLLLTKLGSNHTNDQQSARLWLSIPGFNIQPSEFYKIGYVLFLANWMQRKNKMFEELPYFIACLGIILLLTLIFAFLPDFGTILVLGLVGIIMYWFSGGKAYYIFVCIFLGLGGIMIVESHVKYIHNRIEYFLDPSKDTANSGIGYQITNALTSIGAGGFRGRGYGKGLQKFGNVPEAQSDFIFAAFLEEVGFLGGTILLLLYAALGYTVIQGLKQVHDEQDRYIVVGCLALLLVQAWINMGVNSNLIPLTGLTLPFISHGGSALIVNCLTVTIMIKILATIPVQEAPHQTKKLVI